MFAASVGGLKSISPPLANNLALLSREMVDLLKTCTHCTMSFNRFIPAYHHHFGRQCRVADYGFTKLIDLLEALPNIVQVFYNKPIQIVIEVIIIDNFFILGIWGGQ